MLSHRKMSRQSKKIDQTPLVTPIYQSSTFIFPDTQSLKDYQLGKRHGYLYTRYGNPTMAALEARLAILDGAERSLVLSSGMAAVSVACLTRLRAGDQIVSSAPLYGGTAKLFDHVFKKLGISTRYFPAESPERVAKIITPRTKLIYLESPTNPNLKIIDLDAVSRIASRKGIFTIIDSTFATPVNQQPLKFGIDAVIHSATKYLGGHSDLIGGVISGTKGFIAAAVETMKLLGGCADPHQAFLIDRGLKTLEVRVHRHNENALHIARFLETDKRIARVIYPGLESHPQHKLAEAQMSGYGGMVSFDLGSEHRAVRFVDSLKIINNAVSLGGVESLISIPIWTSHMGLNKKELAKTGVTPGLVRLSVGLEEPKKLIQDIKYALKATFKK
jgi:cystathionine beta-lyase/cystathionine gamma-synthase